MVKGYCSKYNPKNFQIRTIVNEDEFPICRRRDMPHNITIKNNIQLDNRYVVPHNIDLIVKYQAHINVAICGQFGAIKYLFRYVNKRPDGA